MAFKGLLETITATCPLEWCQKRFRKITSWQIGCCKNHSKEIRLIREVNQIYTKNKRGLLK